MRELTPKSTARAVARNFERRVKVRAITFKPARGLFTVLCDREHEHTVEIERRGDGRLFGQCFLMPTGEACPSEMGRRVCHHVTGALGLFLHLERESAKRAAPEKTGRTGCKYRRDFRLVGDTWKEFSGTFQI